MTSDLPDPRRYPSPSGASQEAATLHALAQRGLTAAAQDTDALDCKIASVLGAMLTRGDGAALADAVRCAPSLAVYRHLWRALSRRALVTPEPGAGLAVTLFAIPVVIVVATTRGESAGDQVPGVLPDIDALRLLLREQGALSGNRTFALCNALVAAGAIDIDRLPALLNAHALGEVSVPLALPPAPIVTTQSERAHLRFIVGSALAAPGVDLLADTSSRRWAMPLARALIAQLSAPGRSVVALPRPAASVTAALVVGHAAQRDVSAQLFASHALRELRATAGEPVAVISAHEAPDAPGGGELRVSLSCVLSPRDAYGFRCPIYPVEAVADVAASLVDLLVDCRVADIRLLSGVHADLDPLTGGPLLFKPDALPPLAPRPH